MQNSGKKNASDIIKSLRARFGIDYSNEILLLKERILQLERALSDLKLKRYQNIGDSDV
jgi:hypothetical protein